MLSMKSVKRAGLSVVRIGVPVVLAFSVAGCGGGGGGGGSSSTSSTSSGTAVAVTTTNSPQVAGDAYNGANSAQGASSNGAASFVGVVSGGGGTLPSLAAFAQQQVAELQSLNASGQVTTTATGITGGTSVNCPTSGTMAISYSGSGTTLSPGDTAAVTFNACTVSSGYTINGSFQFAVSALTGTLGTAPWSIGGTFTFNDLSLTTAGATETVSGTFTFSDSTSDNVTTDTTLSGASLTVQSPSGTSLTLRNFNLTGTDDAGTGETSFYGSGQVLDPTLNGYVTFSIPSNNPLVQLAVENYPQSGTMTITGANNTSVLLTVTDSTDVQLQEDTTGDGTYDTTVTEPWTSLGS